MRHARRKEIQEVTNTEAEAIAILEALRYCVSYGYTNILVQTDSILTEECYRRYMECTLGSSCLC